MSDRAHDMQDQLLAYHLGHLAPDAMRAVERRLDASPELARQSADLLRTLGALDDWTALPESPTLESQILARTRRHCDFQPTVEQMIRFEPIPATPFAGRGPSWRQFAIAAACVALIVAVGLPTLARAGAQSRRAQCASNLRDIAHAHLAYRLDHDEQLPFAGPLADEWNWRRDLTPGVRRYRNSRNRFLLARRGYLADVARFVCPDDERGVRMRGEELAAFDDFGETHNCSYDSQLLVGRDLTHDDPDLVVYSDPNPLFDATSTQLQSRTHQVLGGHNVARLGGAVTFATSSRVGIQNDDIWRIGTQVLYTGSELPRSPTDSFMVP